MANSRNSSTLHNIFKRMLFVAVLLWIFAWGYVAWRGISLITESKRFISLQPPGRLIPEDILSALETGQSYLLRAFIVGATVPIVLSIGYWICRGFSFSKDR